jgi:hypothetical protein
METLRSILLGSDSNSSGYGPNVVAYLAIENRFSLEETARMLQQAFGGNAKMNQTDRYDEFPAFVLEDAGLHVALLGLPDPEVDLRDERDDCFQLQVKPLPMAPHKQLPADISSSLAPKLQELLGIPCEPLD